jgi:predicted O-linked N-acetylglucosamine transferase (SPINDLY family)
VTFGSFNNLAKITHKVIEVWSSILKRVPTSRLIMKCKPFASPSVQNRILTQFQANGIESSRVELLLLVSKNVDHLAAYSGMDISLDPWPYAGTTTTCESLLMGVPVITLKGNCHAHNVGLYHPLFSSSFSLDQR